MFQRANTPRQTVRLDSFLLHRHVDNFNGRDQPVWLFLNINPETCTHPTSSLDRLVDQCAGRGISPEKLALELVETAGDSNFERLWQINPTIVKIDRSLLVNAEHHSRARQLLDMGGVKRCFMLNSDGVQQGNLAFARRDSSPQHFNPLYRSAGACWAHREYFLNALERLQSINCSRASSG